MLEQVWLLVGAKSHNVIVPQHYNEVFSSVCLNYVWDIKHFLVYMAIEHFQIWEGTRALNDLFGLMFILAALFPCLQLVRTEKNNDVITQRVNL